MFLCCNVIYSYLSTRTRAYIYFDMMQLKFLSLFLYSCGLFCHKKQNIKWQKFVFCGFLQLFSYHSLFISILLESCRWISVADTFKANSVEPKASSVRRWISIGKWLLKIHIFSFSSFCAYRSTVLFLHFYKTTNYKIPWGRTNLKINISFSTPIAALAISAFVHVKKKFWSTNLDGKHCSCWY